MIKAGNNSSSTPQVFLAYSSVDLPKVTELYQRLKASGVQPWFTEEDLLPGQNEPLETKKAMQRSNFVLICISSKSVEQAGVLQRQLSQALNLAEEQPEGQIFVITLRLDNCPIPARLNDTKPVNYFEESGYTKLLRALQVSEQPKVSSTLPNAVTNPSVNPSSIAFQFSKPVNQPPIKGPLSLSRADRQKLAEILLNLDQLFDAPRPFLMELGLPRQFVMGLTLPTNNPNALASTIVDKLENYGRLIQFSNETVLGVLIEKLLMAGLGSDEQEFLQNLLVNNHLLATPRLAPVERLESIVSEKQAERWRSASFLYQGAQRLKAVCRIETESKPLGTGFLIAPNLVLTNYHVVMSVPDEEEAEAKARKLRFRFGFFEEENRKLPGQLALPSTSQPVIIASSGILDYDFALLHLKEPVGDKLSYLSIEARELVPGEDVFILQHPAGWEMQFMGGTVVGVEARRVKYTVNTLSGTSGSPVFDSQWRLVALHSGSGHEANQGIPMLAILPLIKDLIVKQV
jgi:hypothetical protein